MLVAESVKVKDVTSYVEKSDSVPLPFGEISQKVLNSVSIDPETGNPQFYSKVLAHLINGRIDLIYFTDGAEYVSLVREHPARPFLDMLLQSDHWYWSDLEGLITPEEKSWLERTLPVMRIVSWAEKHHVSILYL